MIIVINGIAKSGKDLFIKFCQEVDTCHVIFNISYIDSTKWIAKYSFSWNGEKDDKGRKLLSDIEEIRINYNNGPFVGIVDKIQKIKRSLEVDPIIFIHCRRPIEIQKLKEYYKEKCITLLIQRDNIDVPDNFADKFVYDYNYDMVIKNNGTYDDLKKSAKIFLDDIDF